MFYPDEKPNRHLDVDMNDKFCGRKYYFVIGKYL